MILRIVVINLLIFFSQISMAEKRILTLGWNVESGDNDPRHIESQLKALEGYDIVGLTEVRFPNAQLYADAVEHGEGAGGSLNPRFEYEISDTGGADRMMIIWDDKRFRRIDSDELSHIGGGSHRVPMYIHFELRSNGEEFLYMVNHLARGNEQKRNQQANELNQWARQQSLPIIAVGDYNFDYSVDEGIGNQSMTNFIKDDVWTWLRPDRLHQTQVSEKYYSVLDFIFTANMPIHWTGDSRVLLDGFVVTDTTNTSDHRPIEARFLIK